jgi:Fe-Mn family superoxide dismutase
MSIKKMKLSYSKDHFSPIISEETFNFHYEKHYQNYINKLNALIKGTEFESLSLVEIIKKSEGNIFNNAAQVWNHEFYWKSLSKNSSNDHKEDFFSKVNVKENDLKDMFLKNASGLFGSGWCWLVKNNKNEVEFFNTSNAETPMQNNQLTPLFVCDVWEHAYYVDYRNDRVKYLNNFWNIINWEFVNKNFS